MAISALSLLLNLTMGPNNNNNNNNSNNSASNNSTDDNSDNDDGFKRFNEVAMFVIPSIFGVIAILGFVGNLLVIVVVVANKQMQSTTNILINSLAVADLLFIVVCVPLTAVTFVVSSWPLGSLVCRLYGYVIFVTAHASVYTLVLMSLDRYLAVVHPIRSMTIRCGRNTYLAIALTWAVIGSANVPVFLEYGVVEVPDCAGCLICTNARIAGDEGHGRVFFGLFFAFAFAVPLGVVTFLYGAMIRKLLYGGMAAAAPRSKAGGSESMRAKRRVTRMVVVVVVIFAVCWLPLQIIFLVMNFGSYPETVAAISAKVAFNCLAYMNSCVNPILYAFLSDNFRKSFRRVLACCFLTGSGFQSLQKTDFARRRTQDADDQKRSRNKTETQLTQRNAVNKASCVAHHRRGINSSSSLPSSSFFNGRTKRRRRRMEPREALGLIEKSNLKEEPSTNYNGLRRNNAERGPTNMDVDESRPTPDSHDEQSIR